MKEHDMKPIIQLMDEAIEKLKEVQPNKKYSKRERALHELRSFVKSYSIAYSEGFREDILSKIDRMLNEGWWNTKDTQ